MTPQIRKSKSANSMTTPRTVLFTHTSSLIGGGNKVLLSVFEKLDRSRYVPVSVIPERGPLENALKERDVRSTILDLRPRMSRNNLLITSIRLAVAISKYSVDIIHANDPFTYRAASIAAAITRTPRICHFHHPDQDARSMAWAFSRMPNAILVPTMFVKTQVSGYLGSSHDKIIHVVGNPIDTEWFRPSTNKSSIRVRLGLQEGSPQITIIGALAPHKGHDCFLRAACEILKRHPDAKFNIVGSEKSGDREWAKYIGNLASTMGISGAVRFWGFVPDEMSRDLMRVTDIFMLPTKLEGFGLVLAESLACGVPVIASAIRPLDEIVVHGKSGFLLQPDDFMGFARTACELIEASELREKLSDWGRKYVRENFDSRVVVDRIVERYDLLLNVRSIK